MQVAGGPPVATPLLFCGSAVGDAGSTPRFTAAPQHSTSSSTSTAWSGGSRQPLVWRALLFTRPHLAVVRRDSLACRTSKLRPLEAQAVARPAPAPPSRVRARVHAHARTSPVRHRCAHARTEASSSAGPWPGQCRAVAGPVPGATGPVPDRGRASAGCGRQFSPPALSGRY